MKRIRWLLILNLAAILTVGCATQHYQPKPITPAAMALTLEARTLEDPGLRSFITKALDHPLAWPPKTWHLRLLTLAAFYFNPGLAVARAQVQTARAGIMTARMRPNPVLELSPGIPSPYLLGLSLAFPIVTSGKREYRIELAEKLTQAAQLNLAEAAWKVRGAVRAALLSYLIANRDIKLTHSANHLWATRVARLSEQLTAGEIPRPQVEAARIGLLDARVAASRAQGRLLEARAALAAAIGIPVAGLEGARFAWPDLEKLPSLTTLSERQIQADAVLNRLDVHQALAQYGAAQAALRLEIARSHSNFQLGPGYQYEERKEYFAPVLSIPLPIFNRNQGPITQAEARRSEAAARLVATQASVIAQSEQAVAQYEATYRALETAQAALENFGRIGVPMTRQAVAVGETEWLSLNSVLLERSAALQVWINSLYEAQAALGQLEDAVQKPLEPADTTPLVLYVGKQ